MQNITFDFLGQHRHGTAFHEYLRLRKSFFVDALGWDIPHNDDVEMDQYDNPCAHYSLVLRRGKVARRRPHRCRRRAVWGHAHLHAARRPARLHRPDPGRASMPSDIATDEVWECTRLVISDRVASRRDRAECLSLIVEGLVDIADTQRRHRARSRSRRCR